MEGNRSADPLSWWTYCRFRDILERKGSISVSKSSNIEENYFTRFENAAMKLSSFAIVIALALGLMLTSAAPSFALKRVMQNSTPVQLASQSDALVIGTVTAIEPEAVQAAPVPNGNKVPYMVAVVKIHENLLGVKGVTHIRIGFLPSGQIGQVYDDDEMEFALGCGGRWQPGRDTQPREGQTACFFLKKHHNGEFYTMVPYGAPLSKKLLYFDDEIKQIKKAVKVMEKPLEALQVKVAAERQFAAALLVQKYRAQQPNAATVKVQPISAEESKLILTALGEMTWGDAGPDGENTLSLQNSFWQLGLSDKDGWKQPTVKDGEDYNTVMGAAVKKWCQDNTSTYQILRNVADAK